MAQLADGYGQSRNHNKLCINSVFRAIMDVKLLECLMLNSLNFGSRLLMPIGSKQRIYAERLDECRNAMQ
ncbi:MAG: hypothetical protein AAF329_07120 [Cyanobacteria bacterium P01_A01_bin.17]